MRAVYRESVLPQHNRNLRSIRLWEGSGMPGFGSEILSDADIASKATYLKEMTLEESHTG